MELTKTVVIVTAVFILNALADLEDDRALINRVENLYKLKEEEDMNLPETVDGIRTDWIIQKLDHFSGDNNQTWQMRYMINDKYFEAGGPIFIYVGGEWSITPNRLKSSIIVDMTKQHNGILFQTEHRFYGKSQPTEDLSLENLKYLHSRQALADLAHFIRFQRQSDQRLANSKVIITGCSYSGSIAVWFSKLYPELVDGAWASSAPLLAKLNFKNYNVIVGKALLQLGSRKCYKRIQNGILQLETMFADSRAARAKKMLNLCKDFDHKDDLAVWSLFESISQIFAVVVQTQSDDDVSELCKTVLNYKDDLTAVTTMYAKKRPKARCIKKSYDSDVKYYRNTVYDEESVRPFRYQMCNEFGWFKSSSSTKQPFGSSFPESLFTRSCFDIFGRKYTRTKLRQLMDKTNRMYGGKNPEVENVYMTHGGLDPWSSMGLNASQGASVIPEASHCSDFLSKSFGDSPEMRNSKERLLQLVHKWLA